jgi:hypothetical protein
MALDDPQITPMQQLRASVPAYPTAFPIADRLPYAYQVDMGLVRSEMAAGNTRQRRAYDIMPHFLALSFHLRIEELFLWQTWVNANAYSFFLCPVSTMYAGEPPNPDNIRSEVLRFTSDLTIAMEGWDLVAVTVSAELANDAHATAPIVGLGGWIIAGTPAAPNVDWWIAGTPAAPSAPNWVLAGTPAAPSSL